jgi:cbb3-type cytochrome oxidase subunit 3
MMDFGVIGCVFAIIFGTVLFLLLIQFIAVVWEMFRADKD